MTLDESFMTWRKEQITVDLAETVPIFDHREPMTNDFAGWREFKRLIQPQDELWTFRSPEEEWDNHMGWQGIVLVREGKLVEVCVTAQN